MVKLFKNHISSHRDSFTSNNTLVVVVVNRGLRIAEGMTFCHE